MKQLARELIPHAPQLGLYVAPDIPAGKLEHAIGDFAKTVQAPDVLALFDSTLLGSAKDGAVFTSDRIVFQNNDLEPTHVVRYEDLIRVDTKRKLLGGRVIVLTVNRGRATFDVSIDFSGKPDAAEYVARFLREAMLSAEAPSSSGSTDVEAVRASLEELHLRGVLASEDLSAMLEILERR